MIANKKEKSQEKTAIGLSLLIRDACMSDCKKKEHNMENDKKKTPPPPKKVFETKQINLFQDFLYNSPAEQDQFSNTIELWDAVPKYFIDKRRQEKIREKGLLPTATRNFIFKDQHFIVKIRPARITVNEQDKEFYPAAREELVEDALRKLACRTGNGYFNKNRSGVFFTLHQLRRELKKRGHTLSYYEVIEALDILSSTTIEISPLNGKILCKTSPLTSLVGVSKDDLKTDPSSRWYADFSNLVTEGIQQGKYRQYNYDKMMSHKGQLSRYIHKRLSHNYIQASMLHPYTITMQSIARDSGLLECKRKNDNRRKLEKALEELKSKEIILYYESKEIRGQRNFLKGIKYKIFPHQNFTAEVKKANKRLTLVEDNPVGLRRRSR